MKKLILALMTFASLSASADLGAGVLYSPQQDYWDVSGGGLTDAKAAKLSSRYGVIVWVPVFLATSLRTGYLIEDQEIEFTTAAGKGNTKVKSGLIPLNLQFDVPVPGLYVYGGVLFASNITTDPGDKFESDVRVNAGLGYEVYNFALASLLVEAEYQHGTKNVSPASGVDLKSKSIAANVIVKVGF